MSCSYLVLGETGESFQISNKEDLLSQSENFMKNISAGSNDIMILDNKGNTYNSLNKIDYIPETKYFLYCKRYFKEEIKNFKNNLDKIITPFSFTLSINLNSIPDVDSSMDLLKQNSEYLIYSPENIKETYNKMMDFFDKFKAIYKGMKINCKICEQIKENYKSQSEGVDNMYKNISNLYVKCLNIYSDLQKKQKDFIENNKNTLQLYDESIQKIKNTELHPEIIKMLNNKIPNCKYLIDIYYNENDMNKWRNNCVEEETIQIHKNHEKEKIINKNKEKIKYEKSSNMIPLKNEWTFYSEEYEKLLKDKSPKAHLLITDLGNDFSIFKSKLLNMKEIFNSNLYNSNPNYVNSINDACNTIKQLNDKYSNITSLRSFQISLEPLTEYTNKMKESIERFSIKINELFNNLRGIKNDFEFLIQKFNYYSSKLEHISKDFEYLLSPNNFLKAYSKTLLEIKRKIIFNHKLTSEIVKINSMVYQENYLRDIFLKENKNYVTPDFREIFQFEKNVKIKIDFSNENCRLPNIFAEGEKEEMLKSLNIDSNENLIQNLINQAENTNLTLKNKEKENQSLNHKFENQEKKINNYLNEMQVLYKIIDDIVENFNTHIIINEQNLERKKKECESLKKYITSNLNNGNNSLNCPLCKERALNGKEYLTQVNYIQDIQNKLDEKIKENIKFEKNYLDLVSQTNIIKKSFMNYANLVIEKKNIEKNEIKKYYENKFMSMEDILSSEKNFNREILSSVSNLKDKNKEFNKNYLLIQEENKNLHKIKETLEKKEKNLAIELNMLQDKYDKLNEDYISMKEELDNKIKDYVISNKNLEKTKSEQMETINLLNISHQNAIETLNKKIIKITEEFNLKLKKNQEDYQRLSQIDESFQKTLKENISLKQQISELTKEKNENEKTINELINELNEKEKKTQEITNYTNNNSQINYNEEVLNYKKVEKGLRCIFVPYSDGIFICINLSEEDEEINNENQFFNCKYILDLESFDEELKNLIVENSLIVIGKIGKLNEFIVDKENNFYDLPEDKKFISVTLDKIDYVIGFPGDEMVFRNYNFRNLNEV